MARIVHASVFQSNRDAERLSSQLVLQVCVMSDIVSAMLDPARPPTADLGDCRYRFGDDVGRGLKFGPVRSRVAVARAAAQWFQRVWNRRIKALVFSSGITRGAVLSCELSQLC